MARLSVSLTLRRLGRFAAAAAILLPMILSGPQPVDASSQIRGFTPRFSVNAQGAITLIGNTLGTCNAAATYNGSTCAQAQAGTATPALNNNNNNWSMVYVDLDGDSSTINSSSADLNLPAGATVLFAELTWAGYSNSAQRGVAKFRVPGGSYVDVSAVRLDSNGSNYSAIADVTPLVAGLADPNGTYWAGNVQSTSGSMDRYAAWALVVVYQDLTVPLRNLVVFDGYAVVNSTAPVSINTTVSGFLTPASGAVQTKIGAVVYEGDMGFINDSMQLDGTALGNTINPSSNFFNSSMSINDVRFTAKNPDYVNQMAFDADIVDASGILANSATSATITYTTNTGTEYDTYYPTVVTFQTDVFTPVVDVVKTSQNLTHTDAIYTGDVIRYTLTATSSGNDAATFVVLNDPIPDPLTYVPGSAYILTGWNSDALNPKTDALGDDQVDFSGGVITFRLGQGADATMGGQLAYGESTTIQFDCTVDAVPEGTQIVNQAYISYSGETLGGGYADSSDSSSVSAGDDPDTQVTNAPPVAVADTVATLTSTPVVVDVLGNDYDADGNIDPSTVSIVTPPSHGTITDINATTGAITYAPTAGYTGTDVFSYEVCDDASPAQCDQANVTVTISAVVLNPPTARPDGATTNEDTSTGAIAVLANDSAGAGASLVPATTSVIAPATSGSTSVNTTTGAITYTPNANFHGNDSFIYQICDNHGLCDTALVSIDVASVADPPTANNDSATVQENSSVIVTVLANDTDPENNINISSVAVQSGPSHGTTAVGGGGAITYTPTVGYYGPDSFTYRVCDTTSPTPLCSGNATVSITVTQAPPVGANDSYNVQKNVTLDVAASGVLDNDTDPNGLTLHAVLGTDVSHGTLTLNSDGSFSYTPTSDYTGPDSFTYTACTPALLCSSPVTVDLTVANGGPTALDDSYSVDEDDSLSVAAPGVLAYDTDPNGDTLTASLLTDVSHGTLTLNSDGSFDYTPTTGYYGPDSFTYEACDPESACDDATVSITVTQSPPVGTDDSYNVQRNVTLNVPASGVLSNDTDPNGLTLHAVLGTDVSHGTLTLNSDGSFSYAPTTGYTGSDSFTYTACTPAPGSVCSSAVTVSLTVGNGGPTALDDSYSVDEDDSLSVAAPGVLANDTDPNGDSLTASLLTDVSHGTLTLNSDGSFDYTPTTGYYGPDSFTYEACDPESACDDATVSLTVTQTPPVGTGDSYNVQKNVTLNVAAPGVLDNDTDPNGLTLHAVLGTDVSHGSLTLNADGSFSYAPTTGYTGFDSFTYTACTPAPGSVCSSAVTVNLTVDNDGPTAVDDTYSVVQDDSLSVAAPGVLANDTDPNGDTLTVSLLTDVSHGSLTLNSDGSFDYTPTTGYVGPDSFTYEACDTESACDDATVSINVTQSPPVGLPDGYSVHKNLSLSVAAPGVLSNDTDPNGLTLHAVLDAGASHGTLTLFSDGSFDYSPVTGYAGSDSFTYTACTPAPGSVCSSPVTVTVTVINDGPTAVDDSFSAYVNSSLTQGAPGVLANDTDPNGDSLTASLLTDVSHGTLTLHADGSFDYTPATDYLGPDSFTYRACDPNSACSDATVSINVVEPAVPVASDDYAFAVPGTPIAIQVLLNDVAGSGSLDLSSLQVTGAASHGSTVVNGDGTITYSTAGGVASDSFDYRICNTLSPTCATATVYVTIDRAPTFGPGVDGSTISLVIGGSLPGAVDVTDPDSGDTVTLSYTGSLPPGLVLNPDGTWSGTTAGDTPGSFSITIHACDQFGLCTDADVTIVLGTSASPSPPTTTPPPTSIGAPERRAGDPPLFLVLVTLVFGLLAVMAVQTRAVRRPRVIPVSRRDGRRS